VVGGAVTFAARPYLQLGDNLSAYHDLLPFMPAGPRPYLSAANLSIRRTVVEHAGVMGEHFRRAEDLDWSARLRALGYQLYFEPHALVWHTPLRRTIHAVWRHWTDDAHDTLQVRLHHTHLLQTPALARHRHIFLWGAPLVALWATARTFAHPRIVAQYWHTLPLVYLTKLAWCWGAFRHFPIE
jgi:GT2 family glycosyltransferase